VDAEIGSRAIRTRIVMLLFFLTFNGLGRQSVLHAGTGMLREVELARVLEHQTARCRVGINSGLHGRHVGNSRGRDAATAGRGLAIAQRAGFGAPVFAESRPRACSAASRAPVRVPAPRCRHHLRQPRRRATAAVVAVEPAVLLPPAAVVPPVVLVPPAAVVPPGALVPPAAVRAPMLVLPPLAWIPPVIAVPPIVVVPPASFVPPVACVPPGAVVPAPEIAPPVAVDAPAVPPLATVRNRLAPVSRAARTRKAPVCVIPPLPRRGARAPARGCVGGFHRRSLSRRRH